jgi:hypothetical protein
VHGEASNIVPDTTIAAFTARCGCGENSPVLDSDGKDIVPQLYKMMFDNNGSNSFISSCNQDNSGIMINLGDGKLVGLVGKTTTCGNYQYTCTSDAKGTYWKMNIKSCDLEEIKKIPQLTINNLSNILPSQKRYPGDGKLGVTIKTISSTRGETHICSGIHGEWNVDSNVKEKDKKCKVYYGANYDKKEGNTYFFTNGGNPHKSTTYESSYTFKFFKQEQSIICNVNGADGVAGFDNYDPAYGIQKRCFYSIDGGVPKYGEGAAEQGGNVRVVNCDKKTL